MGLTVKYEWNAEETSDSGCQQGSRRCKPSASDRPTHQNNGDQVGWDLDGSGKN